MSKSADRESFIIDPSQVRLSKWTPETSVFVGTPRRGKTDLTVIVPEQPTDRAAAEQIAKHLHELVKRPGVLVGDDRVAFMLHCGAKLVAADHIYSDTIVLRSDAPDDMNGVELNRHNPDSELILTAVIRATRAHHRAELAARYCRQ